MVTPRAKKTQSDRSLHKPDKNNNSYGSRSLQRLNDLPLPEDPVSEGEYVSEQRRTPDNDLSTNTSFVYASNESLDKDYLNDRAKSIEDLYATIDKNKKNHVKSPPHNLHTSLNSTISASNFITPEKLMEKLERTKVQNNNKSKVSNEKDTNLIKKSALKKSPRQKENTAKRQLDLRSDQSSQTFLTSQIFTNTSPSKNSYTQANIPLSSKDLTSTKISPSSHNTSFDTEHLLHNNARNTVLQTGYTKVETYDGLFEMFMGDLSKTVEVVSMMITLGKTLKILMCVTKIF